MKSLLRPTGETRATEVEVPRGFHDFCAWVGVLLSAGQAEFGRVAYDGTLPVDAGLAQRLFGEVPVGRRDVVAAVCGGRAGKSYVFVALRLVHGMLVRDVSAVPRGIRAAALIIAPRDDLRMEVFRYALGIVRGKPELAAMLVHVTADTFRLRRPDGKEVEFKTGVATSGGTAARGQWWTDFALDECAFFRDNSFKVNDEELFRAGSARVLPGGQTIIVSTPWAEAGLLHRMWKTRPADTCVIHAPTLLLNDSPTTRTIIERARQSDPDNARREFDAEFMTSGTTVFFDGGTIDTAFVDDSFEPEPGDSIAAGADFGFRSDSSALLMVAKRGDVLHIFAGTEERPGAEPLKPSVTCKRFTQVIGGRCAYVMADAHYREAIAEHLESSGLIYAPAPMTPADTYVRARMVLRERKVQIHRPNFDEALLQRLEQQMREVQGKPTAGGGMSIVHPRWAKGGHGDLCAALVLAVWQVTGDVMPEPLAEQGSAAWQAKAKERRRQRLVAQQERPAWMAKGMGADRGANAHWRK